MSQTLSRLLVLRILLVSTVVTSVLTCFSFYFDYQSEMGELDHNLSQLEQASSKGIANLVFLYDENSLQSQINGLVTIPSILEIKVLDDMGETMVEASSGIKTDDFIYHKAIPLVSPEGKNVGKLTIMGTKKFIYETLLKKVGVFFVSQGIKTLTISFILLFVFNYYVTNHLSHITDRISGHNFGVTPIKLNKRGKRNELDILVDHLNEYGKMTEDKKAEDEVAVEMHKATSENASRLASLAEMATGIAHEVNNPLAILVGNLHLARMRLEKHPVDPKKILQNLELALQGSDRIHLVIGNLIKHARDAEGDDIVPVPLKDIVEEALSLCLERFRLGDRTVKVPEIPDAVIACREIQLVQVLISLLNNAYDATETDTDKKWIKLDFSNQKDKVVIHLEDSGPGIPPSLIDRIFDPFFTTKGTGKGSGLGLAVSKSMVEGFGGSLNINTERSHTCFDITIPKAS